MRENALVDVCVDVSYDAAVVAKKVAPMVASKKVCVLSDWRPVCAYMHSRLLTISQNGIKCKKNSKRISLRWIRHPYVADLGDSWLTDNISTGCCRVCGSAHEDQIDYTNTDARRG